VRPIFLLSLPRSGSTLLQRLLATHPDVATAAEPWILLPLLYAARRRGIFAEYGHDLAAPAIEEFADRLPGGREELRRALARCAVDLYERAAGGCRYFLDKTPRYHLLLDDLFELFPEGRFIFLWRNPLAVAASIIETWGHGRWNLNGYAIDLEVGLPALVGSFQRQRERAVAIRYEELVRHTPKVLAEIYAHLDLEDDGGALDRFAGTTVPGAYGDAVGSRRYQSPSAEPLDKWRTVLANPVRKAWARRYLDRIGAERLRTMGYDVEELLDGLAGTPTRYAGTLSDSVRYIYGQAHAGLEFRLMKAKLLDPGDRPRLLPHS
jgi:hypothetical protein